MESLPPQHSCFHLMETVSWGQLTSAPLSADSVRVMTVLANKHLRSHQGFQEGGGRNQGQCGDRTTASGDPAPGPEAVGTGDTSRADLTWPCKHVLLADWQEQADMWELQVGGKVPGDGRKAVLQREVNRDERGQIEESRFSLQYCT